MFGAKPEITQGDVTPTIEAGKGGAKAAG